MNTKLRLTLTTLFLGICASTPAQDYFQSQRAGWLKKAEDNKPVLSTRTLQPVGMVELVKDQYAFQGWKAQPGNVMDSLYGASFRKLGTAVVDFGEHITGYYQFTIKATRGVPDAPLRFKLTFGEVPAELATAFDPYPGTLSRAWLQDETITVMELPATITLPRRFSFRYVKIELLGSSPYFDFGITGMECSATTSVQSTPAALAAGTLPMIAAIDRIGLNTLKECMQTVYEDGPKRDRRLWIGDLYLEALANTYSFRNHGLTKRCLYLLAGLSQEDGFLHSNVFERPTPHPQKGAPFLFDYSMLYTVALKEYLAATGDRETALDLWPLVRRQMDNPEKYIGADGLFDNQAATKAGWWLFVDWKDALDRQASIQGITVFAMKQTLALAKELGTEKDVAGLPLLIKRMTEGARKNLWDKSLGLFVSGPEQQVSYASQAWMVLSGVATKSEGQHALKALGSYPGAVTPGTPYLYHYYIEALLQCGLTSEAKLDLVAYWGGMAKKGADTFWEVYDPSDELLSPYRFYPINSYCHAWSCTPVYFIRKYPGVFQK